MLLVLGGVALYLLSGGVIGGAGYTNEALGFSFDYRTGPNGYVLQEAKAQVGTKTDFVTNIVLTGTKELAAFREQAEAREGPPTIGVMVFKNSQNLFPEEWAKENMLERNGYKEKGGEGAYENNMQEARDGGYNQALSDLLEFMKQ